MAWPIAGIVVLGSSYLVGLGSRHLAQGHAGAHAQRTPGFLHGQAVSDRTSPARPSRARAHSLAYGINACASVIGAVLAMLCAIHLGLSALLALALACYLVALMTYSTMAARETGSRIYRIRN